MPWQFQLMLASCCQIWVASYDFYGSYFIFTIMLYNIVIRFYGRMNFLFEHSFCFIKCSVCSSFYFRVYIVFLSCYYFYQRCDRIRLLVDSSSSDNFSSAGLALFLKLLSTTLDLVGDFTSKKFNALSFSFISSLLETSLKEFPVFPPLLFASGLTAALLLLRLFYTIC